MQKIFLHFDKNMPSLEEVPNLDNNQRIEPLETGEDIETDEQGESEITPEEFEKSEAGNMGESPELLPEEQLGELGKKIKDRTQETEGTKDELEKLRKELDLTPSTEKPSDILDEKNNLENLNKDEERKEGEERKEKKDGKKEREPMHTIWNMSGKEMIELIISIPPSQRKIYQNLEEIEANSLKELKEKDFDPEKCFMVIYKTEKKEKIDVIAVGKNVRDKDVAKLIMMEVKDYFKDEEDALLQLEAERRQAMERSRSEESGKESQPEISADISEESKPDEGSKFEGGSDNKE